MIYNTLIFFTHIAVLGGLTLLCLRWGKEVFIAWLSLLAVSMNLFVLKQTTLFGLAVTCSDALVIAYLLGLNLVREYWGSALSRKIVWISFFIAVSFLLISQIHLAYIPNAFDQTQPHFRALLTPLPRVVLASLFTFLLVQLVDLKLFALLKEKTQGRYLTLRMIVVLLCSQTLDTLLFSFLGLYGIVGSMLQVILFSLLIKIVITLCSSPFIWVSKQVYEVEK